MVGFLRNLHEIFPGSRKGNADWEERRFEAWRDKHYGDRSKPLRQLEKEWWQEVDPAVQRRAVSYLKEKLPQQLLDEIAETVRGHGDDWVAHMGDRLPEGQREFYSFHFCEGMGVRNLLRDVIFDYELPSGNWDDFYMVALELAAGCG